MPEPILAVDFGRFQTVAALVTEEQWRLLGSPPHPASPLPPGRPALEPAGAAGAAPGDLAPAILTGPAATGAARAAWPAVGRCELSDPGVCADALAPIRAAAQHAYGGRIQRLALAAAPEQVDTLVAACQAFGFLDVELVPDPVAAALDPANGPDYPPGELVIVGDLGTSWTVALVRVAGNHTTVLARESSAPAREPERDELAARLRWLVDAAAALVAQVGAEPAGTVLVGGWAAHRGVAEQLRRALPGQTRPAVEPDRAVLRGLARWAAGAGGRQLPVEPARWRVRPLSWRIPDQDAQVLRWLVDEGRPFAAGAVLAQVRTAADRVFDLTADADGALLSHQVRAGARTGPTLVAAVAPAVSGAAYDPPAHRYRWSTTGGALLTPQLLVEWDATGGYVHTRDLASGAVAGALEPAYGADRPQRARVFVDAAGRLCLLAWNLDGEFWVWDIAVGMAGALPGAGAASIPAGSGAGQRGGSAGAGLGVGQWGATALRARFSGPAGVGHVLVDERAWRMAAEVPDSVSVGRYRRTAVWFWDLNTGQRLDKVVADDWGRRHPGYAARSATDRFAASATSPDRRLRAVTGEGEMSLFETATDRPVFHATYQSCRNSRTAFSADGRFLLTTWETDDRSTVDVWQL